MVAKNLIPKTSAMKWVMILVASALLIISTLWRLLQGQEADHTLCWTFTIVAALVFGANVAALYKK